MRFKCFLLLAGLGLILGAAVGSGQSRGEPAEGKHAAVDLNARWEQLAGGGTVWRRADITDAHQQFIFDLIADKLNVTNGEITKEQFLAMPRRPAANGGGGHPKGGEQASHPEGETADAEFRRLDTNGDGLLDSNEMDETLRAERDKWDANHDGFIDLAEFHKYHKARTRRERAAEQHNPPH